MAYAVSDTKLCQGCRGLTFVMIRHGYSHPLSYQATVSSGQTCRLCRLIICSMGKLQHATSAYEVEKTYPSTTQNLLRLPAVSRHAGLGSSSIVEEMQGPEKLELAWSRHEYLHESTTDGEVRKGNFNQGETIQITSPESSRYRDLGLVPLQSIEPAASTRNYQMLRKWLVTCESSHETCRTLCNIDDKPGNVSKPLPTRVIDVGSPEEVEQQPRLFETKGISGKYLCLSHRWGKSPILRTLVSTLEEFQKRLPMDQIPPTFHDAIKVTRQLGFRYLWIDSLCIVQDDENDWKQEAQMMGSIFEESTCTIAAVDALDDVGNDRGLFLPRDRDPLAVRIALPYQKTPLVALSKQVFKRGSPICVWKFKWLAPPTTDSDQNTVVIRPRTVSLYKRALKSKWHSRGWILQERFLSRRIIYYTEEKLYWSCLAETGEEEASDPKCPVRPPFFARVKQQPGLSISGIWETILTDYASCKLTYAKDRLLAIRGLSTRLEARFPCYFNAGILHEPSIHSKTGEGLLWYSKKEPLLKFNDFHAPSWTWASLDGIVSFSMPEPSEAHRSTLIRNLHFKTWSECNEYNPDKLCKGTCVSGTVSFVGPMGNLYRGQKLKDVRFEGFPDDSITDRSILSHILGTALTKPLFPIPRYDQDGKRVAQANNLPVPEHTEILECKCRRIVGFFVPDRPSENEERGSRTPVVCTAIQCWKFLQPAPANAVSTTPDTSWSRHECWQEETTDIIGVQEVEQKPGVYRRLGRGRVISYSSCCSWVSACKDEMVTVV